MGLPATRKSQRPTSVEVCSEGALSIEGAAAFCSVCESAIEEAIAGSELETLRHGRKTLVPRRLLTEWLAAKLEAARAKRAGASPTRAAGVDADRPQRTEVRPVVAIAPAVVVPAGPWSESAWSMGARTVTQAQHESGLSRQLLWHLMDLGTLTWKPHGGRGTRLIAWKSIVEYLESLPSPI